MMRLTRPMLFSFLFLLTIAPAAFAQTDTLAAQLQKTEGGDSGTVVSSTRSTLLISTSDGTYKLFELTTDTTRPKTLTPGMTVTVTSKPNEGTEGGARLAIEVKVTAAAPAGAKPPTPDNIPPSIHNMEKGIQKSVKRYQIGIRAGAAIDPEQVLIGAHGQFGPIFSHNFFFRPNLEFSFGEVTDIIAINLEAVYRMPVNNPQNKWAFYFGAGPSFNFVRESFTDPTQPTTTEDTFSFSDFSFDGGLNVLAGIQSKGGMFLELKASAFAPPSIKFLVGYSF